MCESRQRLPAARYHQMSKRSKIDQFQALDRRSQPLQCHHYTAVSVTMKALTFAMTICNALGLLAVNASHAQQQSNATFQIAFCNMSDYSNILVALVHKKD